MRYKSDERGLRQHKNCRRELRFASWSNYPAGELRIRLDEVAALAKKHGIKHLSFLIAAPGSHTTEPDKTVVLTHVKAVEEKRSAVVDWMMVKPADAPKGESLSSALSSMDTAIHPR